MSDLASLDRPALMQRAEKVKHLIDEDINKMPPEKLREEIYSAEQFKEKQRKRDEHYKSMSTDEYKALLEKYNIEFEDSDLEPKNRTWRNSFIEAGQRMEEENDKISIKSYPRTTEEIKEIADCSPQDSKYHLEKLGGNPYEVRTDKYRDHENIRISHQNNIRVNLMNLQPLPLYFSDSDLETMLSIDNYEIGESCKEFLSQFDKKHMHLKEDYKQRMNDIIALRNLEKKQEQEEKQYLYKIEMEFQRLSKVPQEIVFDVNGAPKVSEHYEKWLEDIKKSHAELSRKQKAYDSMTTKKAPEKFIEILDKTNELVKKHSK